MCVCVCVCVPASPAVYSACRLLLDSRRQASLSCLTASIWADRTPCMRSFKLCAHALTRARTHRRTGTHTNTIGIHTMRTSDMWQFMIFCFFPLTDSLTQLFFFSFFLPDIWKTRYTLFPSSVWRLLHCRQFPIFFFFFQSITRDQHVCTHKTNESSNY